MMSKFQLVHLRRWRDELRRTEIADERLAQEDMVRRAQELRDEIVFLLKNGLNEGAQATLATLAEEDMSDFCIMVDLAEGLPIEDVAPLDHDEQAQLAAFLAEDPWRSLAVDIDTTVAIAVIEDAASNGDAAWYDTAPNLIGVVARVLDNVNSEQLGRFAGELSSLHQRTGVTITPDLLEQLDFLMRQAASRIGVRPPVIDNA